MSVITDELQYFPKAKNMSQSILLVDDETKHADMLAMNLELEGYTIYQASDGHQALEKLSHNTPELVVLDILMPDMDGFEVLEKIREFSRVPIIMLSVKDEEKCKIKALEMGADDYVTKPCNLSELTARIRALLRRVHMPSLLPQCEIRVDKQLKIDFRRRLIIRGDGEYHLRPTEFRLLYQLVSSAGNIIPHETLLRNTWGYQYRNEHNYLWLYINYLRQKIGDNARNPRYILKEHGIGYKFREIKNLPPIALE